MAEALSAVTYSDSGGIVESDLNEAGDEAVEGASSAVRYPELP